MSNLQLRIVSAVILAAAVLAVTWLGGLPFRLPFALEERLARAQQLLDSARGHNRYTKELQRHGLESVQREVSWLSDLIAAERSGGQTSKPTEAT